MTSKLYPRRTGPYKVYGRITKNCYRIIGVGRSNTNDEKIVNQRQMMAVKAKEEELGQSKDPRMRRLTKCNFGCGNYIDETQEDAREDD